MNSNEIVKSSKSKTNLVVIGYDCYKKRDNRLTTAWNCAEKHRFSCRTNHFSCKWRATESDLKESQSRYLFGKGWSPKNIQKDLRIKSCFNHCSITCISIASVKDEDATPMILPFSPLPGSSKFPIG